LSLLIGYLAMISVHVNPAWLRLSPPLVSYAHAPANEILPVPPIRSPDPRRWWPAVAVVCGLAAVGTGGWLLKRAYAPPPREQPRRPPDTRAREFQRVLPLWDDYLSRHPDDGPAHMERAGILHLLGRDGDARAEAAKACDLGVSEGCVRARELSAQR
jgi:hypothetical protein